MPQRLPIEPVAVGMQWPSGRSRSLAMLHVDDAWVVAQTGRQLLSGGEDGWGPWVGIGGKLPSGTCVELVRYELDRHGYELRADFDADPRGALQEFLSITGLAPSDVHWRCVEA